MTAYSVTGYEYSEGYDTLKVTAITAGKVIAANKPIVFNSTVENPVFVPTAVASNTTIGTSYVKGFYCDSIPAVTATQASYKFVYEFRDGDRGVGFYKTDGSWKVPGGTAYGLFGFNASNPGADSYVFGRPYNAIPTSITSHSADEKREEAIYTLQGVRLKEKPTAGTVYIVKMSDGSVRKQLIK